MEYLNPVKTGDKFEHSIVWFEGIYLNFWKRNHRLRKWMQCSYCTIFREGARRLSQSTNSAAVGQLPISHFAALYRSVA